MKNTKRCPKCEGAKIIRVEGRVGPYWDGNNIPMGVRRDNAVLIDRYICSECGYSEEWIDSKDSLQALADKWGIVE